VVLRGLGRLRVRVVFEGLGSAQRFAFRAQTPRQQSADLSCCLGRFPAAIPSSQGAARRLPFPCAAKYSRTRLNPDTHSQGSASSHGSGVCSQGSNRAGHRLHGRDPERNHPSGMKRHRRHPILVSPLLCFPISNIREGALSSLIARPGRPCDRVHTPRPSGFWGVCLQAASGRPLSFKGTQPYPKDGEAWSKRCAKLC
jgi:hypothetical protein